MIEIDAASNTGVDNIRELRSNAIYRPARSRFKIYVIDEVHMLTKGAFNALLKTLEEPPSHVKFIFATTEPERVPATIQSRVQRFEFKAIPTAEIAGQLESICQTEKVEAETPALRRIARLANGSMRDALSLLDQILSMAGRVTVTAVDETLPPPHDELLARLIDHLADGDAAAALDDVDESLGQGYTIERWCDLLIRQIRDLMILNVCGAETDLVDLPEGIRPTLIRQSARFDAGAYVHMITLLEELRRTTRYAGSGRALAEAVIIRLSEASRFSSVESILQRIEHGGALPTLPQTASTPRSAVPEPASKKKAAVAVAATLGRPQAGPPPKQIIRPAPKPPSVAPPSRVSGGRVTQLDLQSAHAEPMVRAAIEMFEGRIIDVQRGAPRPPAPVES